MKQKLEIKHKIRCTKESSGKELDHAKSFAELQTRQEKALFTVYSNGHYCWWCPAGYFSLLALTSLHASIFTATSAW